VGWWAHQRVIVRRGPSSNNKSFVPVSNPAADFFGFRLGDVSCSHGAAAMPDSLQLSFAVLLRLKGWHGSASSALSFTANQAVVLGSRTRCRCPQKKDMCFRNWDRVGRSKLTPP